MKKKRNVIAPLGRPPLHDDDAWDLMLSKKERVYKPTWSAAYSLYRRMRKVRKQGMLYPSIRTINGGYMVIAIKVHEIREKK